MICAENMYQAKNLIHGLEELATVFGLQLNKDKTFILSDRREMLHVPSILGIKKLKVVKYLGMKISLNGSRIVGEAKASIVANAKLIASRIQSQSSAVQVVMFTAYIRSLLIYHMTSLVAAGYKTLKDIDTYEIQLKR